MGRKPCCDKVGLKRGPWTIEEDHKLMNFIINHGVMCWRSIPKMAGLLRCGKSCRLRWINYLRPDLKRGGFTEEEEDQIIQLHETLGNRWSKIASHFKGRTDNEIKNHWNTKIKKRLKSMAAQKTIEPKQTTDSSEAPSASIDNNLDNGINGCENKMINNNEDDDLLSDYEIFNGSLEVIERWLNEEAIEEDIHDGGQSSSSSFQGSFNQSMSHHEFSHDLFETENGDSGVQNNEECLDQWFDDDEMNTFLGFNNYQEDDDQLIFSEEHNMFL